MKFVKELLPYVIIIVVVVLIRTFIITPVRVQGSSMKTTLNNGDILLLYKLGKYNRSDVVVLKEAMDNEIIIKRIVGMPGEIIEIVDNTIYINGEAIEDKYAYGKTGDYPKTLLKEDEYFLLGDNRVVSKDSRIFGPVKKSSIKGKTIIRLFPFNKIGTI